MVVRDGEAIGALLTRMGAQDTRLVWEERRMRREVRATANRLANFDDANLRRSARAAVAAAARVERALEILGDTVPEHLASAGKLRVEHRQASLEELGRLAEPPMTKDAVAGAHQKDLETQDKHGVKYLQYWYNDTTGQVFCLVEAPDKEAAIAVHREAHGLVADQIIEVQAGH